MIFAGRAKLLDRDFRAAMAFATCAEDASAAVEARRANSFQSFADNDSGMLEAFLSSRTELGLSLSVMRWLLVALELGLRILKPLRRFERILI